MLQHAGARRAALAAALAALAATAALAPPAAAGCGLGLPPHDLRGPFASPLGGVWIVLPPHADGSVEAVHLGADGGFRRSVTLHAPGVALFATQPVSFAVDSEGGFRVTGAPRDEEDGAAASGCHLYAFGADGGLLGDVPIEGHLFAFDESGVGYSAVRDEEGRLSVLRLDTLGGRATTVLAVEEPVHPGNGHAGYGFGYEVALDGEGGALLLVERDFMSSAGSLFELRLVSPRGHQVKAWRLPRPPGRYQLVQALDGTAYLADTSGNISSLGPQGVAATARLAAAGSRPLPVADGGFLVATGSEYRWLAPDGEEQASFRLGRAPRGMSWSELSRRWDAGAASDLDLATLGSGEAAAEARRRLVAQGAPAVDGLIEWLAASPPPAGPLPPPWLQLVRELLAADPDAVGRRFDALLDRLPEATYPLLTAALARHWPRPSPAFVARLADDLRHADAARRGVAAMAFAGIWTPQPGAPARRFPAEETVVELHLEMLATPPADRPADLYSEQFFVAQLPHAAPRLDAVLADPDHPARPAVADWLGRLPGQLHTLAQVDADGEVAAALAAWAPRWAASADPRVSRAGRLLAAAAGDPDAVAALPSMVAVGAAQPRSACDVLWYLQTTAPEVLDAPLLARLTESTLAASLTPATTLRLLRTLEPKAPAAWWSALAGRLAEPGLSPAAEQAVVTLLVTAPDERRAGVSEEVRLRVARSGVVERRLAGSPRGEDFQLAGWSWDGLAEEATLRARLEEAFLAACEVELPGFGGEAPPGCLLGMAAGGVGRRVPDAWLTASLDHYLRLDARQLGGSAWPRTLAAIAGRRGPWPGLAEALADDRGAAAAITRRAFPPGLLERVTGRPDRVLEDLPALEPRDSSAGSTPAPQGV